MADLVGLALMDRECYGIKARGKTHPVNASAPFRADNDRADGQ